MRSLGWVTMVALVAPVAAAVTLPAPAAEELPEGCSREAELVVACEWTLRFEPGRSALQWIDLPARGPTLLDATLEPSMRTDLAWGVYEGDRFLFAHQSCEGVAQTACSPLGAAGARTSFDLLDALGETRLFVRVVGAQDNTGITDVAIGGPNRLPVEVAVRLVLTTVPPGTEPPSEPAATRDDPQLLDREGDAVSPELDIVAAWFDDAFLDDDMIEVHVRAPGLSDLEGDGDVRPYFAVRWTLLGDASELDWNRDSDGSGEWTAHVHYRYVHGPERPAGYSAGPYAHLIAWADYANDTLSAKIPLRFLGSPDPHARFTNMSAESFDFPPDPLRTTRRIGDTASDNVRPFAVGGPEVWRELRGTSAVAAPEARPWYRDPLAPENVPDTLQAVGFLGAIGTAGGGYLLVRRRRERMHARIAEVDAAFGLHTTDSEAALKALEDLEHRFDQMMLDGKLDDKQHDVLARRIERSAYKILKLKRA